MKPYKCPCCDGRGERPSGLYNGTAPVMEPCRSCQGTGVLWESWDTEKPAPIRYDGEVFICPKCHRKTCWCTSAGSAQSQLEGEHRL